MRMVDLTVILWTQAWFRNVMWQLRNWGRLPRPQYAGAVWIKANRSNGNGGNNCVEVAFVPQGIAVRDSKDPTGPALLFTQAEWDAFTGGVLDGDFNR